MNAQEEQLEKKYREIHVNDQLDEKVWINEAPATPFVGENYGANGLPKVLVYGSADFGGEKKSKDNFFPWVHITPVADGSLLTVGRYLLEIFGKEGFSTKSKDFLQQIAVSNYGKFSLTTNKDYARVPKLLEASHLYVLTDLEVLKPDVVILPKSIYGNSFNRLLKNENLSKPAIWTIYQTSAGVINRSIKEQLAKVDRKETGRSGWTQKWIDHSYSVFSRKLEPITNIY